MRGKRIIGIHGLANKPPKEILAAWWRAAILEGLGDKGYAWQDIPFDLIYWADQFYPLPLDPEERDPKSERYLDEAYHPGEKASRPENATDRFEKMHAYVEQQLHDIFLNADLSLNYERLTDRILGHYFQDLEAYFSIDTRSNGKLRERVHELVLSKIQAGNDDQIMLIAHSMGSIIAYDVLWHYPEQCKNIHTLITIGSPLGLPITIGKLAAEFAGHKDPGAGSKTPQCIRSRWVNLYDREDRIAFDRTLADDFGANASGVSPFDVEVFNDYVNEAERNPHKSFGYLRSTAMAAEINSFLTSKISWWNRIKVFLGALFRR